MSTAAGFQVDATTVDMEMEGSSHILDLASAGGSAPAPSIHVVLARALRAVSCLTMAADVSAGLYQCFQVDGSSADATTVDMEGLAQIAELALAEGSASSPASIHVQLSRALWAVSCLTMAADVSAGLYQPARGPVFGGHSAAYYGVLSAILAVVAVEMAVAYWLPRRSGAEDEDDRGRGLAFANGLLRFGVVLLVVMVFAVGGFALTVKL